MCTIYEVPVMTTTPRALMRLRTISETHSDWDKNGVGKVFDHYGRVPESVYQPHIQLEPLEQAVVNNDTETFHRLVQEGQKVHHELKIGEMSCLEYSAMQGYDEILEALLKHSANTDTLKQFFTLDTSGRAFFISNNKTKFFDQGGLAEVNRCEAALYTAVLYDQPRCLQVLVSIMGQWEPNKHNFFVKNENQSENVSASELAEAMGHSRCYEVLIQTMSPRS